LPGSSVGNTAHSGDTVQYPGVENETKLNIRRGSTGPRTVRRTLSAVQRATGGECLGWMPLQSFGT
jgi:hypothetical protein